jgi:multiple sugar transport system substrate-binding protein
LKKPTVFVAFIMLFPMIGCDNEQVVSEPTQLTYYSAGASQELKQLLEEAKNQYEQEHSNVKINFIYASSSSSTRYKQGIDDLIRAGNSPDIVEVISSIAAEWGKSGFLQDLNKLVKNNRINLDDYFVRPLISNFTLQNELLAIPYGVNPQVVFYNKSVFKDAGIPEPKGEWTWEELAAITRSLREQHANLSTVFRIENISTLALSNGGSFMGQDGSGFKGFLDGKPSIEAISWYAEQVREGLFNPLPNLDYMKQLQNGEVGIVIDFYGSQVLISPENRDKIGVVEVPSFPGKPKAVFGTSGGLAVLKASKNQDIALDFIRYIGMDKNEISDALYNRFGISVSKKITEVQANRQADPFLKVKLASLQYVRKDLQEIDAGFLDAQKVFKGGMEQILRNSTDFQKDLSGLAQTMDNELSKIKAK